MSYRTPRNTSSPSAKKREALHDDNQNLKLPTLFTGDGENPDAVLYRERQHDNFSTLTLATALCAGCSSDAIKEYLQHSPKATVMRCLKLQPKVEGHQVLSYAIRRNDAVIVRLLLEYGLSPNTTGFADVPLLAFAIMRAEYSQDDHLEVVKALLAGGADVRVIPEDIWIEYVKTPDRDRDPPNASGKCQWVTAHFWRILAKTANLSVRYNLWKANRLAPMKQRELQVAKAKGIVSLFQVPYVVIGQELAAQMVVRCIFGHVAIDKRVPLVIAFAGLSGHGKTELAKQMGHLLSADFLNIDCTQQTSVYTLIGATFPYQGYQDGAPLNNFLARNACKRCVIFLDEYDKTEKKVRNALLTTMDTGTSTYVGVYPDGRLLRLCFALHAACALARWSDSTLTSIVARLSGEQMSEERSAIGAPDADVQEEREPNEIVSHHDRVLLIFPVIWILATNKGDDAIANFHSRHIARRKDEDIQSISLKPLQIELKKIFMELYSPAVAGRINLIVPFFPFSPNEQAVVAHKFLLALQDNIRKPIDLKEPVQRHLGKALLQINDDGRVCQYLARIDYISELGARSLSLSVETEVTSNLEMEYFHVDQLVSEDMNEQPFQEFVVQLNAVGDGVEEISVFRKREEISSEDINQWED